jgi:hypothetical protein
VGSASETRAVELAEGTVERLSLILRGVGTLLGEVRQEDGLAVEGLGVHARQGGQVQCSTVTEPGGGFRLDGVLEGKGELLLGDPASPVDVEPDLEFRAGLQDLGILTVPRLGRIELLVLDENGAPVPEAFFKGTGSSGGALTGVTDGLGSGRGAQLPAGAYRIFANKPGFGRGNTRFEFEPGKAERVEIRLRRAPGVR